MSLGVTKQRGVAGKTPTSRLRTSTKHRQVLLSRVGNWISQADHLPDCAALLRSQCDCCRNELRRELNELIVELTAEFCAELTTKKEK